MKQLLLFSTFILFSISSYSQVQGPPAPCGYSPAYECDDDGDGFEVFNLVESFSFSTFCRIDKGEPEEYYPISYYLTQDDMNNQVNEIANPEAYTNVSSPQTIYYRANKIVPDAIAFLVGENPIEIKRLSTNIPALETCDDNQDGIAAFDLTAIEAYIFCGSTPNSYSITYHETQADADSSTNEISPYLYYASNVRTVYARVEYLDTGYVETTSFELVVWVPPAINSPPDLISCDDVSNNGVEIFDLSQKVTEISQGALGNFDISFHVSELDAQNNLNSIPLQYTNIANPQTIYVRAENTLGSCFAIDSFDINVVPIPLINQPTIYEVCDDISGDKVETFDLNSKNAEIIGSLTGVEISYYLTQSDAENRVNQLPPTFNNYSNPQTIYVNVMDDSTGCSAITTMDLYVKDCSNSGVIEVNAFYDENTNGSYENDETLFVNGFFTYEMNNDGIQHVVSSSTGSFEIISDNDNNTYDISCSLYDAYLGCNNVTTSLYEDVSATNGNLVTYNFPITKTQDCADIAIYLVSYVSPRPGFDYVNYLVIENIGLETVASGSVEFVHDPLVTFNDVTHVDSGNTVTNTATGFILDFVDLQPNQKETVLINMNVPIPTPLGTLLTNMATYAVTDLSAENNTSVWSETVIGSYDPNDILESHGPEIFYDDFKADDYLFYTIRFQNVGTADAINVSIDNTLDARLDKSTIQMLSSSHNHVFTRTDNQLNWQFDNIHLPSEDMDEPNSHGYVNYKIKPKVGYQVGDIIPNTAEIYFDFNPAVVTNTFETEFVTTLSNEKFSDSKFLIYPNPADNIVQLKFNKNSGENIETKIYDIQGKLILNSTNPLQNNTVRLNVSTLKNGLYFLKVDAGIYKVTKKLIIN